MTHHDLALDRAHTELTVSQRGVLAYAHELGGELGTVQLSPYMMLRSRGLAATPESIAPVLADIGRLEDGGYLSAGYLTDDGVMVMLLVAFELKSALLCETIVALYRSMSSDERNILARWECNHVESFRLSTTDWPGWPTVQRRQCGDMNRTSPSYKKARALT